MKSSKYSINCPLDVIVIFILLIKVFNWFNVQLHLRNGPQCPVLQLVLLVLRIDNWGPVGTVQKVLLLNDKFICCSKVLLSSNFALFKAFLLYKKVRHSICYQCFNGEFLMSNDFPHVKSDPDHCRSHLHLSYTCPQLYWGEFHSIFVCHCTGRQLSSLK